MVFLIYPSSVNWFIAIPIYFSILHYSREYHHLGYHYREIISPHSPSPYSLSSRKRTSSPLFRPDPSQYTLK